MPLTAEDWPIAAAMLPFASAQPTGSGLDADSERAWSAALAEVRRAGFDDVDLTDSWLRYGDLDPEQRSGLAGLLERHSLRARSMSVIRRSVIDERDGADNLAYSHRCLEAAAALGVGVVSVGLHRPLTEAQRQALWFWTVPGHRDPQGDPEAWRLAVERFRELGHHAASLGMLLSLELYEHTYLGSAASAVRLVDEIGMPEVGLNPDIGNLLRLHEPVEDWRALLEATMPFANFWHVKNYLRAEDPSSGVVLTMPAPLESGFVNYREAVSIAVAAGFQGVICAEHYGGDGLSVSAANRDALRRILPRGESAPGTSRVRQQTGLAAPAEGVTA